jgi:ABC-type transport system substrate-binding protein
MNRTRAIALAALFTLGPWGASPSTAAPEGQMTWAVYVSLAPSWFDPAETQGVIVPFPVLYALHDALVKPMPGQPMAPSLAESWTTSRDGLVYEFALRKGVTFHNGDPLTAEDVKFSFARYRGSSAKALHDRVARVEIVDANRVRFVLKAPWPDFLTFYGTPATGAAWIVPKRYVERVGDDGFKRAPVGAGPYKLVSFSPGVELALEANESYWGKVPSVKRLVFRAVPDESRRLTMLKRGEADIAYSIRGALAQELARTPGLTLKPVAATKSPWSDQRVRLAVSLAINRKEIKQRRVAARLSRRDAGRKLEREAGTTRLGRGARPDNIKLCAGPQTSVNSGPRSGPGGSPLGLGLVVASWSGFYRPARVGRSPERRHDGHPDLPRRVIALPSRSSPKWRRHSDRRDPGPLALVGRPSRCRGAQ